MATSNSNGPLMALRVFLFLLCIPAIYTVPQEYKLITGIGCGLLVLIATQNKQPDPPKPSGKA